MFLKYYVISKIIPPYFELDGQDKSIQDLSKDCLISDVDSFDSPKTYFSRLGLRNEETGDIYTSIILAQNKTFHEVIDRALSCIRNQNMGLWPKPYNHASSADIGWFLYSSRMQDASRLSELLSNLIGEHIDIR